MKIQIKTKLLLDGLVKVKETLDKSTKFPICTMIKFHVTKKGLTLTTDNTVNSTEHIIKTKDQELEVFEIGSVMIPPLIIDIIKKMGSGVCITVSDHPNEESTDQRLINLQSIDTKIKTEIDMQGISAVEFPKFISKKGKPLLTLESSHFIAILSKTVFAASTDESTPIFTGVHIKQNDGELIFSTTNRHRLARASYKTDSLVEFGNGMVVSAEPLSKISKLINSNKVDLYNVDNRLIIQSGDTTYTTTLLEGTYPNVDRIIPVTEDYKASFLIHRTELLASLEMQFILKGDSSKGGITIMKTNPEGSIELTSDDTSLAAGRGEIFINEFTGDEMSVSINTKYFIEALKAYQSRMVRVVLTGDLGPILIKPEDLNGDVQLILPYRSSKQTK